MNPTKTNRLWNWAITASAAAALVGVVLFVVELGDSAPAKVKPNAPEAVQPYRAETATPSRPLSAQSTSPAAAAATNSVSATPPIQLWSAPGETTAKVQPQIREQRDGVKSKGRSSPFDPGSLTSLAALRRGDNVVIPLLDGEQVTGKVNLVQQEAGGWVRVGGELTGPRAGSFSLGSSGKKVGLTILLPQEEIAYTVAEQPDGQVLMQEKHLSEVICFPIPRLKNEPATTVRGLDPQAAHPILSSRPGATAVLYLDFDGETVTDPLWNNGNTIVAQPSSLTSAQITEVWNRVKEDFWPFNIDVTTDVSRYDNAPVGSRMRCIITPTDTAAPGAGGVAYLHSFDQAGQGGFSSTIPCWVFNPGVVGVAEAASHELGHTLGLRHDGRTSPEEEYYQGHGSGAVGWAPIMGVGYSKLLVQWSKGEYLNANRQEDDIAIIANSANGFSFVADDAGNSRGSAAALNAPGGSVSQIGVITAAGDVDYYVFTVGAGLVSINANPALTSPNLDILLEFQDGVGAVLASSNPDTALNAAVNSNVVAGTYYVKIQGTGRGSVLEDGYSTYGSIGQYSLSGSINPAATNVPPTITAQPQNQSVAVGSNATFTVTATGTPALNYQWRRNGLDISGATTGSYTRTNAQTADMGSFSVVVTNLAGSVTSSIATLTINTPPGITTPPQNQTVNQGQNATFTVTASGTTPLAFQWRFNGANISAATASNFSRASAQCSHVGNYDVVITNVAGSVTSSVAALSVISPPTITAHRCAHSCHRTPPSPRCS